ncbi:MAG: hypothetical protein JNL97_08445 [Verrucomicrobiales bacterium]|nr:hypothetical protein [Verrucomicrobiales bacterium]
MITTTDLPSPSGSLALPPHACTPSSRANFLRQAALRIFATAIVSALPTLTASARLVIVGETVHRASAVPGGTISGTITVLNRDTAPAEIRVYQTDYRFVAGGENEFGKAGSTPRSNAPWVTLDASQLTLAPNASVEVNYRGTVPSERDLQGTYWSLVMVEQTEAVAPPTAAPNARERKAAIRTVIRHAIQIVSDVGTPTASALKVLAKAIDHDSRDKAFTLDVENRGSWMVRPTATLDLFDAAGAPVGKREAATVRLYPGCSFRYRFDLRDIPAGKYTALAVLDSGDEEPSGAQYTLEVP